MARFKEDVFLALVTDPSCPVDAATAYAASIVDSEPQPANRSNRFYFDAGLLIGLIGLIVWYFD